MNFDCYNNIASLYGTEHLDLKKPIYVAPLPKKNCFVTTINNILSRLGF